MKVALVHDYLTQRGGAERVVLSMVRAFPDADVYTSLYDPESTFPEFEGTRLHTASINRIGALRRHHRAALPFLAATFSRMNIDADVAVCSSSGWAHGVQVSGRKLVYCHAPARWLYQPVRYLDGVGPIKRAALARLRNPLERWDRRAAATADRYVVNSNAVADEVRRIYGIESTLLAPAPGLRPEGARQPITGVEPPFFLCVARLLPYKNVRPVIEAFAGLPDERLVVVGSGPDEAELRAVASPNVRLVVGVGDDEMRWLYDQSVGLVAAAYEDFGLTPVEAASFGKPTAALRFGGYLDTTVDGVTGVFFDAPDPQGIRAAVERIRSMRFESKALMQHAEAFGEKRFASRLRELVVELHKGVA